ncbi:hypothetical protein HB850_04110 [Listeria newyorkensis]|uniref:Uncharacterized protein n=1 Tax=Listeria newyorkensis TaxID=1497681 RepID=A0A841YUH5_9LIST|nr:hypothetical protein [Listeria newyorkensis]
MALDVRENGIYNISTNEQTSINDVLRVMNALLEMTVMSENRPERIGDLRDSRLSNRKFRDVTGWQPMYTLSKGLAQLRMEKRKHETVLVK